MSVLFSVGSLCFLVAPLPGFVDLVGPEVDAAVFFVGSLFFTSAAAVQCWDCVAAAGTRSWWQPHRLDWWSAWVQFAGTLFFNVTTFRSLSTTLDSSSYDRLVWRPDAFGSICFLVSGVLAYVAIAGGLRRSPPRTTEGTMTLVNLLGCVAFAAAAVGAYVLPSAGQEVNVVVTNAMTSLGALGFLVGALLLLRVGSAADAARSRPVSH